jgi:hypothetical protein
MRSSTSSGTPPATRNAAGSTWALAPARMGR